jgi:hypothetical protein
LVGGGAADLFDKKGVYATMRIIAGNAGKAAIHDHCHAINREGSLSHVCRNDDLALSGPRDSLVLLGGWELAVERKDSTSAWRPMAHFANGALDLVCARHEDENVSIGPVQILRNRVCCKFPWGIVARLMAQVFDFYRKRAAGGREGLAGGQMAFKVRAVEVADDDDLEVRAQGFLEVRARARLMSL